MDNPLEQPAPKDPLARVHEFARDLAWGAVNGKWGSNFDSWSLDVLDVTKPENYQHATNELIFYIQRKWFDGPPSINLMRSFEYFTPSQESLVPEFRYGGIHFLLTPKAFSLLNKPATPPKIFISYRHAESSAFALLVEAQLKLVDPDISVFIDKEIQRGDDWEERIEKALRTSKILICILGPDFARSEMMLKEIDWAAQSGSRLISILHNNLSNEENLPARLKRKKWIKVQQENAEEYEIAILKLLNTLGYPTLQSPRPSASAD